MKNKTLNPTRSKFSILRQVCNYIPEHLVSKIARTTGAEDKSRTFRPWSHVVSLVYAQLSHSIGLNDLCDSLQLHSGPLGSIRGASPPSRNGLSHANRERPAEMDDNGFPASVQQRFLGAQWFWVRPFSLTRPDENSLWNDPGPPPYFGGATHAQFIHEIVEDIRASSQLTVADDVTIDISPGVYGNNGLDDPPAHYEFPNIYDGHGHTNNPATGLPYASNLVKRGGGLYLGQLCGTRPAERASCSADVWSNGGGFAHTPGGLGL